MKNYRPILLIFLCVWMINANKLQAQGIGINNPTPAATALLDLTSNNKGLLIPRMDSTHRVAIASPAKGLLVYDTTSTLNRFFYFDGTVWRDLLNNNSGWNIKGNANTDTAVNYVGTTDNKPLVFKVNNQREALFDPNRSDVYIGRFAGFNSRGSGDTKNVFIGDSAGFNQNSNLGTNGNVFIGYCSGKRDSANGIQNVFIGTSAGAANFNGTMNTFVGFNSGIGNISGFGNVFIGNQSGFFNTTGAANTFIGNGSGSSNTTGQSNTFTGVGAGNSNTTGQSNSFYGTSTGSLNTTGFVNCFFGGGSNNTTGSFNSFLGFISGGNNKSGDNNIAIGYESAFRDTDQVNSGAIGVQARVDTSNSIVLGSVNGINGASSSVNVGMGTTKPLVRADINGAIAMESISIAAATSVTPVIVGNRSYVKIASTVAPASRVVTLSNGMQDGQILVIECSASSTFGITINDSSNINANGIGVTLNDQDNATFIWNATTLKWIQIGFSNN